VAPEPERADCLVVGGGPAGLTAALYLRRYHRRVVLVDEAESRALYIEHSHNLPGFPEGMGGRDLLARLRRQLEAHGGSVTAGRVSAIAPRPGGGFDAHWRGRRLLARTVLLATGVVDEVPVLPGAAALRRDGRLRQCPICDGHEHRGRRIVVIGTTVDEPHAQREAAFLAHFSEHVHLAGLQASAGASPLAPVPVLPAPLVRLRRHGEAIELVLADGSLHLADVLYAALGVQPRAALGARLGARRDARGNFIVDAQCATSVPGLYAAGDVVSGLDQLVVAESHGAIAATAIHHAL
jgi:thioredoxin reductase (NADPH)